MELAEICRELMPNGKPDFLSVVKYPMISTLIETQGFRVMHKVVFLMVKDLCNSFNVVRNMNEEQMIEAASMLIDECSNFRLEDYVMMFQMAKRGELFDVHDRIDLQVVTRMLDTYWEKRNKAAEQKWEQENKKFEGMGDTQRLNQMVNMQDMKFMELGSGFSSALTDLKKVVEQKIGNKEEREKLKQIEKSDIEAIRKQKIERGYGD